ncbi:hypothetical protein ONS95_009107 [Cadophora gregata]|uniref:uncharacterized protein n=1 Tax=Cadophora gregata TaxID=51156 RepID=UPI0026DAF9CF|nr:uncharacterized protein ONS95_009107 [Cadophora gregata]KAK0124124.1 hypothetical protein ONS95_009107 [Cadophora gregata]
MSPPPRFCRILRPVNILRPMESEESVLAASSSEIQEDTATTAVASTSGTKKNSTVPNDTVNTTPSTKNVDQEEDLPASPRSTAEESTIPNVTINVTPAGETTGADQNTTTEDLSASGAHEDFAAVGNNNLSGAPVSEISGHSMKPLPTFLPPAKHPLLIPQREKMSLLLLLTLKPVPMTRWSLSQPHPPSHQICTHLNSKDMSVSSSILETSKTQVDDSSEPEVE